MLVMTYFVPAHLYRREQRLSQQAVGMILKEKLHLY